MMSASDRNLRFGWWSLLVFLSLGGVLETLHGFKVGWYVDVGNEMRRLMFTLAHAHGTALALVNIVAALTARNVENFELRASVSTCLIWSGILFPLGFFLGGIVTLRRRSRPRCLAGSCCRTIAILQRPSNRLRLVEAEKWPTKDAK